jgi:hypothetical protein
MPAPGAFTRREIPPGWAALQAGQVWSPPHASDCDR